MINAASRKSSDFATTKAGLALSRSGVNGLFALTSLGLLTDLAHNLLADFHHRASLARRLKLSAPQRIGETCSPSLASVFGGFRNSKHIDLLSTHPYAKRLLMCLERYCAGD